MSQPLCECGCLQEVPPPSKKYYPQTRFIPGHQQRKNAKGPRLPQRRKRCGVKAKDNQLGEPV